MPLYRYKAITSLGKEVEGEMMFSSREELASYLHENNLLLRKAYIADCRLWSISFFQKGIKLEALLLFNQEMIALLKAGIPIPEILDMLSTQPENPLFEKCLQTILSDVKDGEPLSRACSKYPQLFDRLYLSSLKIGEMSGNLIMILEHYNSYLELKMHLSEQLSKALTYPLFLLTTLGIIIFLLFMFVIPTFKNVYADFGESLPAPTLFFLSIAEHIHIILLIVISLALVAIITTRYIASTAKGRLILDRKKLAIPLIGHLISTYLIIQFTRMLALLLKGGVPFIEALQITHQSIPNTAYALQVERSIRDITSGETITKAFEKRNILKGSSIKMIYAGECSSSLDIMLDNIATFQEKKLEQQIVKVTSLIEPSVILILGVLVGGIIISMYLPVFDIANVIK